MSAAIINAGKAGRKKNRRIPSEIIAASLLILLVLFALAVMLAWGASVMSP